MPPSGVGYSLTDDAGGRFQIDPVTGKVTVADADLLLYEGSTSHQVTLLRPVMMARPGPSFTIRSPTRILIRCSGRR